MFYFVRLVLEMPFHLELYTQKPIVNDEIEGTSHLPTSKTSCCFDLYKQQATHTKNRGFIQYLQDLLTGQRQFSTTWGPSNLGCLRK